MTVDAMHTQTETAKQITAAGGDYLLTELSAASSQVRGGVSGQGLGSVWC